MLVLHALLDFSPHPTPDLQHTMSTEVEILQRLLDNERLAGCALMPFLILGPTCEQVLDARVGQTASPGILHALCLLAQQGDRLRCQTQRGKIFL